MLLNQFCGTALVHDELVTIALGDIKSLKPDFLWVHNSDVIQNLFGLQMHHEPSQRQHISK